MKPILALVVAALVAFLAWWWWRARQLALWGPLGPPLPGEHPTIRGASIAEILPAGAPLPPVLPMVKFLNAPAAATTAIAREWAPGFQQGPKGTVSVTYTTAPFKASLLA